METGQNQAQGDHQQQGPSALVHGPRDWLAPALDDEQVAVHG